MKATEQYLPVVLLFYAKQLGVPNFWLHGQNPLVWPFKWSFWAVLSCGAVNHAVQDGSNIWVCGWNPQVLPLK